MVYNPVYRVGSKTGTGINEVLSHSSIKTNERLDYLFRRIELYCELCWNNPTKENLRAYFSSLKTAYNEVFPLIRDNEFVSVVKVFPRVYRNILNICDVAELDEEDYEISDMENIQKESLNITAQCINDLDYIHQILIGSLQNLGYFFRVEEKGVRGAKERLKLIKERGNLTGKLTLENEKTLENEGK
jgi:hypothetical protein